MPADPVLPIAPAARRTRFVELLRTTPPRTVCPNFYILAHANGCAYRPECAYCYLKSSFWSLKEPRVYTNTGPLLEEVRRWIGRSGLESHVLNAGNLSDSLLFEERRPLMGELVELFRVESGERGRPHELLLVTKEGPAGCRTLLERAPCRRVIVSFSLNAPAAARQWEGGAPPVAERLEAARRLRAAGWRVRVRLDPMMQGYDYGELAGRVTELAPERVTLGSLRAERGLLRFAGGEVFCGLVPAIEPGGLARYPEEVRVRLYRQAVEVLAGRIPLGLCEETAEIWQAAGLDPARPTCNCGA